MEWFKGARLNFCENVFKHRDSHLALITTNEAGFVEKVTYEEMYEEVASYAASLRALRIQKGDRVTCFMSNRKEAVYAFLATASIGAIWSGALPIMGAKATVSRFSLINPKILFTVDRFMCEGKEIDMLSKMREIADGLPTLEKIIVARSEPDSPPSLLEIDKCCYLAEFLKLAQEPCKSRCKLPFEQLPFDHPLSISYTSGTTGTPKALVHSGGAYFAQLRDHGIHQNITREDTILSLSPVGWISWTIAANCLQLGMTLCLFEGQPYFLSPTYFWDLVERFQTSVLFISTTVLEEFERRGYVPASKDSLSKLRIMYGSGSPVKPQTFDFVTTNIKRGICFASAYGSTELLGFCAGVDENMPIHRGEIQCFALGVDAKCLDQKGNMVINKRGDLVIANPLPSLPLYLYGDQSQGKSLRSSYLARHPGYWDQKDECWINPITKGFVVFGRSDETMISGGERFSSSEIYSALESVEEIEDSICVSQQNVHMDERAVLFVKMREGKSFSLALENKIRVTIARELSTCHVPVVILETPDIPYNINSKKMEMIVKMLVNKRSPPNRDLVANPECLDFYTNLPQLAGY